MNSRKKRRREEQKNVGDSDRTVPPTEGLRHKLVTAAGIYLSRCEGRTTIPVGV